jgi:hypothetical protein
VRPKQFVEAGTEIELEWVTASILAAFLPEKSTSFQVPLSPASYTRLID